MCGNGDVVSSGFSRGSVGVDMGFLIKDNQQLGLKITRNFARDSKFPALPMDLRKDDTWLVDAKHDITFKDKLLKSWSTTAYTSLVNHLMDNFEKDLNPRPVNAETEATTYTYGGRTEGKWKFNNSTLYTGFDVRIEGADGTRKREILLGPNAGKIFYDNVWQDSRISKTGVFGEYHLPVNTFQLVMAGRLEFNSSKSFNPDDRNTAYYPSLLISSPLVS